MGLNDKSGYLDGAQSVDALRSSNTMSTSKRWDAIEQRERESQGKGPSTSQRWAEMDKQLTREENMKNRSEFTRSLISGIDETQGMLYGAAGMAGQAFGLDSVRDFGYRGYQRNKEEAEMNPLSVEKIEDIHSAGDFGKWLAGTAGKLAPTVAQVGLSTVAGSLAGSAVPGAGNVAGGVAGAVNRGIIKKVVEGQIAKEVGKGLTKEAAKKAVGRKIGGNIGMVLGSAALESGGMWTSDADKRGVENANPWSAMGFGALSGASELVSPSGTFLKRVFGLPAAATGVTKEAAKEMLERAGKKEFAKSVLKEIPKSMVGEGAQEVVQEFLGVMNEFVNDPSTDILSPDNISKYANAVAGGAAMGPLFGGVEGGFKYSDRLARASDIIASGGGDNQSKTQVSQDTPSFESQMQEMSDIDRKISNLEKHKNPSENVKSNLEALRTRRDELQGMIWEGEIIGQKEKQREASSPKAETQFDRNQQSIADMERWQNRSIDIPETDHSRYREMEDEERYWNEQKRLIEEQRKGPSIADRNQAQINNAVSDEELATRELNQSMAGKSDFQQKLDMMQAEVNNSETSGVNQEKVGQQSETVAYGASSPKWMEDLHKKLGYAISRKELNVLFDKARKGKPLTDRQQSQYAKLEQAINDYSGTSGEFVEQEKAGEFERKGYEVYGGQKMAVSNINPGDTFVGTIGGERGEFTVHGIDENGMATIQGKNTHQLDISEHVPVEAIKRAQWQKPDPISRQDMEQEGYNVFQGKKNIPVTDLKPGDKIVGTIDGVKDEYVVRGINDDGEVLFQDGITRRLDMFDEVEVHGIKRNDNTVSSEAVQDTPETMDKNKVLQSTVAKTVPIIKGDGGMLDVEKATAKLPPSAKGYIRLFRAESPTVKYSDIFKEDAIPIPDEIRGIDGKFYTTDLSYADYFRYSYGRDANITYIDVPVKDAEKFEIKSGYGAGFEYFVPAEKKMDETQAKPTLTDNEKLSVEQASIKQQLSEGKQVSEKVLADYPDLKPTTISASEASTPSVVTSQESDILTSKGTPWKSKAVLEDHLKKKGLQDTHEALAVEGGFVGRAKDIVRGSQNQKNERQTDLSSTDEPQTKPMLTDKLVSPVEQVPVKQQSTKNLKQDFDATSEKETEKGTALYSTSTDKKQAPDDADTKLLPLTEDDTQYSTDTAPGQGITTDQIKVQYPGQQITTNKDGSMSIQFKNGKGVRIKTVDHIGGDDIRVAVESGRMQKNGVILGQYQDGTITLNTNAGNIETAIHENFHALKAMGMITPADEKILNNLTKTLSAQKKYRYELQKDVDENQANTLAQLVADREQYRKGSVIHALIQKIADFFDAIVNIGRQSETKLAMEYESGSIYGREAESVNEFAQDANTPDIRYSTSADLAHGQIFYSAIEKSVQAFKQKKAHARQWMGMINKIPGLKQEELEWMGLEDWLNEQKGSVTKDQILDYIRSNEVLVEESIKGGNKKLKQLQEELNRLTKRQSEIEFDDAGISSENPWDLFVAEIKNDDDRRQEYRDNSNRILELNRDISRIDDTKFSRHTLPGGENYKELLLMLPAIGNKARTEYDEFIDAMSIKYGAIQRSKWTQEEVEKESLLGELANQEDIIDRNSYKSSHWSEPNVMAHIRFSEREVDGRKVLHIEEVQSDWHQEGRKKGYRRLISNREAVDKAKATFESYEHKMGSTTQWDELDSSAKEPWIADARRQLDGDKKHVVPDAPLKKTWPLTAFKRMVRYAAENGFDTIAWTPGEIQAERYDLSKQVDQIGYAKNNDGTYEIQLFKGASDYPIHTEKNIQANRLEEYVGKDVAQRIFDGKGIIDGDLKMLSDLDLKVGGEGMKGFYDKILPAEVKKFFGKEVWGNPLLGEIEINADGQKLHALEVTMQMKDKALKEGMPLFQAETRSLPGQGLSTQDIQKHFKGQQAFLSPDGSISIRFGNGKGCRIKNVVHISGDDIRYAMETGRMGEDGIILGKYQDQTITLNKNLADTETLTHETLHLLKDMGVLTPADLMSLDDHRAKLVRDGKYRYEVLDNREENQANTLAQLIADREAYRDRSAFNRIIQKVMDFLNGLIHIGRISAVKLAKEIETGNIYGRETNGQGESTLSFQTAWRLDNPDIRYSTNSDLLAGYEDSFTMNGASTLAESAEYNIINQLAPIEKVYKALKNKVSEKADFLKLEKLRISKSAKELKTAEQKHFEPIKRLIAAYGLNVEKVDRFLYGRHAHEANERLRRTNARAYLNDLAKTQKGSALENKIKAFDAMVDSAGLPTHEAQEGYLHLLESELTTENVQSHIDDAQTGLDRAMKTGDENKIKLAQGRLDRANREMQIKNNLDRFKAKPSGMTDGYVDPNDNEAADIMKEWGNHKGMLKIAELFDKMNDDSLDISHKAKRLTDEEYEAIKGTFNYYAPLKREGFEKARGFRGIGSGVTNLGNDVKVRGGSTKRAVHILANAMLQHQQAIIKAEKAKVAEAFINFVKENPNKSFWSIEKVKTKAEYDGHGNIVQKPEMSIGRDANELVVKYNGETLRIQADPDNVHAMRIYSVIRGDSTAPTGFVGDVVNGLAKFNRLLSTINTTYNPEFVFSNLSRDVQTAMMNLESTNIAKMKGKVFKWIPKAMAGLKSQMRGDGSHEWSKWAERYEKSGAKIGWIDYEADVKAKVKDLEKQINLFREGHQIQKAFHNTAKFIDDYNSIVENATRLSAFRAGIEAGMKDSDAALMAKNLTVNFNQRGAASTAINSLYLFANAGIQGSVRIIQNLKHNPKRMAKILGGVAGTAAGISMANNAIGGDDEDGVSYYSQIDDYIKSRNMIFMIPGTKGKYAKIPLPWGYNVFWAIGTEIGDSFVNKDYKVLDGVSRMLTTTMDAFNPIQSATIGQTLSPTFFDPIMQVAENKTWSGSPLMPAENKFTNTPKPDSQRYFKSVRPASKNIAEFLNWASFGDKVNPGLVDISPETLDMLWDTFTGGSGKFLFDTASLPFNIADGNLSKIPVARKIIGSKSEYKTGQDYQDNITHVFRLKEQAEIYPEKIQSIRQDKTFQLISQAKAAENKIRRLREKIKSAKTPDQEERINQQIEKTQKQFNKIFYARSGA